MTLPILAYAEDERLIEIATSEHQQKLSLTFPKTTCVVLGRGSRPEIELHLETCRRDNIPIYRRRGGGCAVVLDSGNLVISLVLFVEGIGNNHAYFERISQWIAQALCKLHIHGVYRDGHSDLVLADRKIGGACIYRTLGVLHYSATLLLSATAEAMERYLRHPPREPDYRQRRSHRDFVGQLLPGSSSQEMEQFRLDLFAALKESEASYGFPLRAC